jgi:prevent-host-death family protein
VTRAARKPVQPISVAVGKARAHFGELLEGVSRHSKQYVITRKEEPVGVLISLDDYRKRFGVDAGKDFPSSDEQLSPAWEEELHLAQEDVCHGRVHGPFESATAFKASAGPRHRTRKG